MRILILGGDGLLGHALLNHFDNQNFEVKVTLRQQLDRYAQFRLFNKENSFSGIDLSSTEKLKIALSNFKPDAVLNAAGIVKQRKGHEYVIPSIEINALLPHRLADLAQEHGARVVQMSTDCVFSGQRGNYGEHDNADPVDFYGKTKLVGELDTENCVTLRTSIIGLELWRKTSLIEWFLRQKGKIRGFTRAIYSGFTTKEMARILERIVVDHTNLSGIWHVSSKPISKFDLLTQLTEKLTRQDIQIYPDDSIQCDRSLDSSRFNSQTGFRPPTWQDMLDELSGEIKQRRLVND